jgi:hypothetical protein
MNLAALRAASRDTLDDTAKPYLWDDEALDRWANNAVREVCLRARLLKDDALSNPGTCCVEVTAGQALVPFDPDILAVRSGAIARHGGKLHAVSSDDMDKIRRGWDATDAVTGPPCFMVMDLSQKRLRLYPAPDADVTLNLRVWRMPNKAERMLVDSHEPMVHLPDPESLVHWVAFEAYMQKDAETYDQDLAASHMALFEKRFGERPTFHDMMRWADTPPRVRHVVMF